MPPDPISQMGMAAIGLHELYKSYVKAGFSDDQAFELVKVVLNAVAMGQKPK